MRVTLPLLALLVLAPLPAAAQVAPLTTARVLTRDVRLGTFLSASVTVPPGAESFGMQSVMSDAQASDPANHAIIRVEASCDHVTWKTVMIEYWNGGLTFDKRVGQFVPNHIDESWGGAGGWIGCDVRAEMDVRTKTTIGLDLLLWPNRNN